MEAKDNNHTVGDGIQQAIGYAESLDVPFAFSSNVTTSGGRVLYCFKNTQMGLCEVISIWMTVQIPVN